MELQELPRIKFKEKRDRDTKVTSSDPDIIATLRNTRFGFNPKTMRCPFCRANITTNIEVGTTIWTHIMAAILFLICMWPCIPCIYCSKNCLTLRHYCNNCHKYLGESGFFPFLRWRRGGNEN